MVQRYTKCNNCLHSNTGDLCFMPIVCQSFAANSWSMLLHTAAAGSEHSADFARKTTSKTNLQVNAVCIAFLGCMVDYHDYPLYHICNYIYYTVYILRTYQFTLVPMCSGTVGSLWMFNVVALWHAKHVLSNCIFKSAGKLFPGIMPESLSKWRQKPYASQATVFSMKHVPSELLLRKW